MTSNDRRDAASPTRAGGVARAEPRKETPCLTWPESD